MEEATTAGKGCCSFFLYTPAGIVSVRETDRLRKTFTDLTQILFL